MTDLKDLLHYLDSKSIEIIGKQYGDIVMKQKRPLNEIQKEFLKAMSKQAGCGSYDTVIETSEKIEVK